ncbi:ATP-dependent helicase [Synechococcales cyanobacterium C]|uniref:ATP-dependent helicase n=1 Tax=Petrachloros mirabilis ULC683 TaxID=2781853 RepID=A0A8K2A1G8_9CYAN|nr:DEAD/DEAH box helicase [Petrachloros mirabilis]NCJ08083.1 ATP-dependent helicase [Petrachloros mirabilis ULC683]
MAILHGSWLTKLWASEHTLDPSQGQETALDGGLFLWAETWSSAALCPHRGWALHPFAMDKAELAAYLLRLASATSLTWPAVVQAFLTDTLSRACSQPQTSLMVQWQIQGLAVPVQAQAETWQVFHSASDLPTTEVCLHPVQVPGLWLSVPVAIEWLLSLPLGVDASSNLGSDLRFWVHLTRWGLDLLARNKFLPALIASADGTNVAQWQPLQDSAIDRARFQQFQQRLPAVLRFYQGVPGAIDAPLWVDLPTEAEALVHSFVATMVNQQVQASVTPEVLTFAQKQGVDPAFLQWLQGLGGGNSIDLNGESCHGSPERICDPRISTALTAWARPIQQSLLQQNSFRTCFRLSPPPAGENTWCLSYVLQAIDDESCVIEADQIWRTAASRITYQGRVLERPQETLLLGLGLASRIYPLIEDSLQSARPLEHRLTPLQAYEFIRAAAWRLEDSGFGVILPESLANRDGWANRLGLQVRADVPRGKAAKRIRLDSLLNFKWELAIGGQTLSKAEFEHLVNQGSPLVEINGEWVELRPQDVRAAQAFFATRKQQMGLSLQDALRMSTGDTLTFEKLPVVNFEATGALQNLLNTLTGTLTVTPVDEPPGFYGELRPYQARGVGWLAFLEQCGLGACLADDMGLGKTIQLIAYLLYLKQQDRWTGPTLLICPTSVLGNWEREVKRFAPQLKAYVHHGSTRPQGKAFAQSVATQDLVITSYPLVPRDMATLKRVDWQGLVLDEAQNIKNPDTKQSQSIRQLEADFRIALTGTPLENRLSELWSILDFLNPGYLGPLGFFQRRFATPIERYGDTASLETLRSLVQPFILRRTKTDSTIIEDLPEKQEMTVFCSLTPEQAHLYERVVQESLEAVDAAEGIQRRGLILATLVKLKQICNHPAQFLHEDSLKGQPQRSGKLKRLAEMLEEVAESGDRALIFTQFAELGKLLQAYLQANLDRETLLLYGNTSKKQREAMIDRFQHDPQGPRLFILSLKAGGVGLNLTRANHVFHFDRWWNPAVENQATDRVFRIGQTRNVQVHKFVCTGTLEERIHEQLESKKALAEQVVGTGEQWLTELDTNQLRNLLLLDRNAVIEEET